MTTYKRNQVKFTYMDKLIECGYSSKKKLEYSFAAAAVLFDVYPGSPICCKI